jgi:seryl-tRNA synthetase
MAKSTSYASQVSNAQTMKTALHANIGALEKRGMNDQFIDALGNALGEVITINSEQERLKGELKAATAALDAARQQLHSMVTEAVKVVKLEMPQEKWIEFGIAGKR